MSTDEYTPLGHVPVMLSQAAAQALRDAAAELLPGEVRTWLLARADSAAPAPCVRCGRDAPMPHHVCAIVDNVVTCACGASVPAEQWDEHWPSAAPARPTTDDRARWREEANRRRESGEFRSAREASAFFAGAAYHAALTSRPTTPTPTVSEGGVRRCAQAMWRRWNPTGPAWSKTNDMSRQQAMSEARVFAAALGVVVTTDGGE